MKTKHRLHQKILAGFVAILMCTTLIPPAAFAAGEETSFPYNITATDGVITSVSTLEENAESLKAIKEATVENKYGIEGDPSGLFGIGKKFGKLHSPFSLTSENEMVTFTMQAPDLSSDTVLSNFFSMGLSAEYKIAVQNVSEASAPIYFYPVETLDDGTLKATIPVGPEGVNCALVLIDFLNFNWEAASPSSPKYGDPEYTKDSTADLNNATIFENAKGTSVHYTWDYTLGEAVADKMEGPRSSLKMNVRLELPQELTLKPETVKIESETFVLVGEPISQNDGTWALTLDFKENPGTGNRVTSEELQKNILVSFDAELAEDCFENGSELFVKGDISFAQYQEAGAKDPLAYYSDTAPLAGKAVATMRSAVTITPADLTIYEGGDGGYEGVYGDEETATETKLGSTSLPHPLFEITGPKAAGEDFDPAQVTFRTKPVATEEGQEAVPEKEWRVVSAGGNSDLYYFEPVKDKQDPVRVTYSYFDENGEKVSVTNDAFDPADFEEGFGTLQIDLYPGNNAADFSNIEAVSGEDVYAVSTNSGTLTVRAVNAEDPSTVTSEIKDAAPAVEDVEKGEAVAVAPANTVYTLNDKDVPLPTDGSANPSLLFDDIIDEIAGQPDTTRTQLLKDAIDKELGAANGERYTLIKYLDLVDTMNGNAWISSSKGTDIYWRYPEGTDKNTQFKVLHFENLHRDNSDNGMSGFDPEDIASATITVVTGVSQDDNFIKFHVGKGGFSPYALVWTDKAEEPGPGPDPDTPVGPVHPVDPTPELERGDHYAYIVGYEDDTIRPQNNITRAEVATIFFRLLTDESREAYFTTDCDFTDVNGSAWYANTVATLSNAGILAGYPDGSFRPNDPITRAEFAAIATRFDDLAAADSTFTDIDGHWAEDAINAAYGAGWVGGYPDGTFRPNNNITRAEVMSLVNRVLDREVDEDGMLDDMFTWIDNEPGTWYYEAVQEATNSHDYERKDADSLETWTKINDPIDWDKIEAELLN